MDVTMLSKALCRKRAHSEAAGLHASVPLLGTRPQPAPRCSGLPGSREVNSTEARPTAPGARPHLCGPAIPHCPPWRVLGAAWRSEGPAGQGAGGQAVVREQCWPCPVEPSNTCLRSPGPRVSWHTGSRLREGPPGNCSGTRDSGKQVWSVSSWTPGSSSSSLSLGCSHLLLYLSVALGVESRPRASQGWGLNPASRMPARCSTPWGHPAASLSV